MGKLNGFILLLLLLSTGVFANSIYVNVTNVKSKKQLNYPYKILKSMGFKMFYKQKSYGYAVYVGPYTSKTSLSKAYTKIKQNFKNARIIVYKPKLNTQKQNTQNIEKPKKIINKYKIKHNGFIVGSGTGYANAPSSHTITSGIVNISEPNSSGSNYTVFAGYNFKNNISFLLNYMYLYADDLEFHNYYSSINYRFDSILNIVPYFGLSLGYSSLIWNTSPILNASSTSNNDSDDIMYGTQVGFNYELVNNISLKIDYSCLFLEHATNIILDSSNKSKLQHNTLHSFVVALQYSF